MGIGLTVSPFYIFQVLHGGTRLSGIVQGAQSAAYGAACLLSAGMVMRTGNAVTWALIGGGGFVFLFPLSCLVPNAVFYGAVTTVAIGVSALYWPAMQSWIGAEPDPKLRVRRMAYYNVAWTAGYTLAPLFVGPLYEAGTWLPFAAAGGIGALGLLFVASLPHEQAHFGEASVEERAQRAEHDRLSESLLYAAWCTLLVVVGIGAAVMAVYTKHVEDLVTERRLTLLFEGEPWRITHSAVTYFSIPAFFLAGARAGVSYLMSMTQAWQHRVSVLVVSQAAAAAACWLLSVTSNLAVMSVALFVIGLSSGVCFFASQTYSVVNPAVKHGRLAIHEGMVGFGSLLGAVMYGLLADKFGVTWPFRHTYALIGVALLVEIVLLRFGRRRFRAPAAE